MHLQTSRLGGGRTTLRHNRLHSDGAKREGVETTSWTMTKTGKNRSGQTTARGPYEKMLLIVSHKIELK